MGYFESIGTVADKKVTHFWKNLKKIPKNYIFEFSIGWNVYRFKHEPKSKKRSNGLDFFSKITQFIWKTSFQDHFNWLYSLILLSWKVKWLEINFLISEAWVERSPSQHFSIFSIGSPTSIPPSPTPNKTEN